MRFAAIFFPFAALASIALATPVTSAVPSIKVVEGAPAPATWSGANASVKPSTAAGSEIEVFGTAGETQGVSLRADYNPLEERAAATLILCSSTRCGGKCYGYNLGAARFNQCYSAHAYNSVYVAASGGLGYGAYVGHGCRGVLIPRVRTCYHITPTGSTFFKKH